MYSCDAACVLWNYQREVEGEMSASFGWRVIVCLFLGHVRNTSLRAALVGLFLQGVILEVRITSQTFRDGLPLIPQQKPWQQLSQLLLSGESGSCGKLCSNTGSGLEFSQSDNVSSRVVRFSAVVQLCLMSLLWLEGRLCHWVHVTQRFWLLPELGPSGGHSTQTWRLSQGCA